MNYNVLSRTLNPRCQSKLQVQWTC